MNLVDTLKVNDILVRQFGYSMILYEFYKVVARKNKTVKLLPLKDRVVSTEGFMQYRVEPVIPVGYLTKDVITKRFNRYGNLCIDKDVLGVYSPDRKYIEDHAD